MTKFNWLHLTDLHMGMEGIQHKLPRVEEELYEDLDYILDTVDGLDLVLFTGDLANTGVKEEFEEVTLFLQRLWSKFKDRNIDPYFLAVPGNHDLVRPNDQGRTPYLLLPEYCKNVEIQKTLWESSDTELIDYINEHFENYQKWIESLPSEIKRPPGVTDGIIRGDFAAKIVKGGCTLGILGLNSAFLHLKDKVEKRLAVDVAQANSACNPNYAHWEKNNDLCILMTHHPAEWLCPTVENSFKSEIYPSTSSVVLHLCGHMHQSNYTAFGSGGGDARNTNQGHSLFGIETWEENGERSHGYSIGQISIDGSTAELCFWPRRLIKKQDESWIFDRDPTWLMPRGSESTWPSRINRIVRCCEESSNNIYRQPKKHISHSQYVIRLTSGGEHLFGRANEIKLLDKYWRSPRVGIVEVKAWGGVGKTTLIWHWLVQIQKKGEIGDSRIYAWSFSNQNDVSSDKFINEALEYFCTNKDELHDISYLKPEAKGRALANMLAKEPVLLILDGIEVLQYKPNEGSQRGKLKDPAVRALLNELSIENAGLCVITSRQRIEDLPSAYRNSAIKSIELGHLSLDEGVNLLNAYGVHGQIDKLKAAVNDYDGHCLSLTLLGTFLSKYREGDIGKRPALRDADLLKDQEKAWHVIKAYENTFSSDPGTVSPELAILYLLGIFDRPVSRRSISVLVSAGITGIVEPLVNLPDDSWSSALATLRHAQLVDEPNKSGELNLHPLIREYFRKRIRDKDNSAWVRANSILMEYFIRAEIDTNNPTLEDLDPFYRAVYHACQAGEYSKAYNIYKSKILMHQRLYSIKELNAYSQDLSALENFFPKTWESPVESGLSTIDRIELLGSVSYYLMTLGRVNEAIDAREIQRDLAKNEGIFNEAADASANIVDLLLVLGDLRQAVTVAKEGIEYAIRCSNLHLQILNKSQLAAAYNKLGDLSRSHKCFDEAISQQSGWYLADPSEAIYDFLPSVQSARYWAFFLDNESDLKKVRSEVVDRVDRALSSINNVNTLDSGMLHLAKGRAYGALGQYELASKELGLALENVESGQRIDFMPRVLLSRSTVFRRIGRFNAAKGDLDRAIEISDRTEMKVYQAECRIASANLWMDMMKTSTKGQFLPQEPIISFLEKDPLGRAKKDIEKAREQIKKMNFGLRELEVLLAEARLEYYAGNIEPSHDKLTKAKQFMERRKQLGLQREWRRVCSEVGFDFMNM